MSIAPNVTIIPTKAQTEINRDKYHQLRVAAYCRVSTAEVRQEIENVPDEVIEPQENEREPIFEDEDLEQEEAFEMSM